MKNKVYIVVRKPMGLGNYSIENTYDMICSKLNQDEVQKIILPFKSIGIIRKLLNILWFFIFSTFNKAVFHVIGDISYISPFTLRKNIVVTILDLIALDGVKGLEREVKMQLWYRLPSMKAMKIIVVSDDVKYRLISHKICSEDKIIVIPCSPNLGLMKTHIEPTIIQLGFPYITQIGLAKNKNINRLIDAFQEIQGLGLILIGAPTDEIRNKCNKNTVIIDWPLSESELGNIYRNSYCACVVSTSEGFGMVILEAQMLGCPVVVSNLEPMKFVAGDAAIFVDPFSISSIKEGILSVKDNRSELIKNGLINHLRFNLEDIAVMHKSIYSTVSVAPV